MMHHEFMIEAVFTNGAKLTWTLEARSTAQASARAWEILARLLDDGSFETIVGADAAVEDLTLRPKALSAACGRGGAG